MLTEGLSQKIAPTQDEQMNMTRALEVQVQ